MKYSNSLHIPQLRPFGLPAWNFQYLSLEREMDNLLGNTAPEAMISLLR